MKLKNNMQKASPQIRRQGFSLVEVVTAIGIAGFALAGLVGLLTVGLAGQQSASRDTAFAAMTREVLARAKVMPFDNLWSAEAFHDLTPNNVPDLMKIRSPIKDSLLYFKADGSPVMSKDTVGALGAYADAEGEAFYLCTVQKIPDDRSAYNFGICNMLKLRIVYTWPVDSNGTGPEPSDPNAPASKAPIQEKVFITQISRY